MLRKGYKIDGITIHERLLNEFTNEYGFNLNFKETSDIFKTNIKPRNIVKPRNKGKKG